jgi:Dolichyl-phosphate-mannose-protein mannosyltransferase
MPQTQAKFSLRARLQSSSSLLNFAVLAGITVIALLIMGYHPGLEDDSFYLAAVKHDLNPNLFPHDADFFRVQFQATIFDKAIAAFVRLTHLPVSWAILVCQVLVIFFVIFGCWRLARRCFRSVHAQWAATTLISLLFTLPLPGIAITIADQYLHPRTIATAAILAAIVAVIDRKPRFAGVLLVFAVAIHAIMAMFGISFCLFLWWNLRGKKMQTPPALLPAIVLLPLGWIFEPASDAWRQAAATRGFYFLGTWHWYEWLGVFAPLVILFVIRYYLQLRTDNSVLPPLMSSVLGYGIFQTLAGLLLMLPPSLERLRPFEPMRYLQLLYILFFLLVGGLLGQFLFKRRVYAWLLLFVPLGTGMLYAQRQMYSASPHFEVPWRRSTNAWVQAFAWIRNNTPEDALFAIDPHYETLPREDQHGFRALAERSVLADYEKDAGMAARVPSLAPRWLREVKALDGWRTFQLRDFARLQKDFGVNWIVLSRADKEYSVQDSVTLTCAYENDEVKVCRLR